MPSLKIKIKKFKIKKPGMMAPIYNPSIQEFKQSTGNISSVRLVWLQYKIVSKKKKRQDKE